MRNKEALVNAVSIRSRQSRREKRGALGRGFATWMFQSAPGNHAGRNEWLRSMLLCSGFQSAPGNHAGRNIDRQVGSATVVVVSIRSRQSRREKLVLLTLIPVSPQKFQSAPGNHAGRNQTEWIVEVFGKEVSIRSRQSRREKLTSNLSNRSKSDWFQSAPGNHAGRNTSRFSTSSQS